MLHPSPLGKQTEYLSKYWAGVLFPIPRSIGRNALSVPSLLPFDGADLWTAYELSWLDPYGKPQVAVAEFLIPASSPYMIESKSFKLYLNSFNNTPFEDSHHVTKTLVYDLSKAAGQEVQVKLIHPSDFGTTTSEMDGECIDGISIRTDVYQVCPSFLVSESQEVQECLYSHLLKSNCPVTGQPDWASVRVHYAGPRIDRAGLLKYIVSFRNHQGLHERCVEQMFMDIQQRCKTQRLTVYARYTRRGGLDINPFRSDFESVPPSARNFRQ